MKENKFLTFFGVFTLFMGMFKMFYGVSALLQGWFFSILWVFFYAVSFPKDLLQKRLIPFFLFYLISVLNFLLGSTCERLNTISDMAYLFYYYFYTFLYFYYLVNHTDFKQKRKVVLMLSIIVIYYAIRTVIITGGNTYFIRTISEDMNYINFYRLYGLADYSLTHAIVFMVPVFFYVLKSAKRIMIIIPTIILLFSTFILIYFGGASTPMLMFFLALFVSLLISPNRSNSINMMVVLISFAIILVLLNKTVLMSILSGISLMLPADSPFSSKIRSFEDSLIYESAEGDLGARISLYTDSWDTFFSHPLFGTLDGDLIGGHAYFVDLLAAMGLLGGVFLFLHLFFVFRFAYKVIPQKAKPYYLLGILLFVALGFLKNLSGNDYFIIPVIYLPLVCMVSGSQNTESVFKLE